MQKLLALFAALVLLLALAACGGGEEWGGYTEGEAKDVIKDPVVKENILENAPGDPATNPVARNYPDDDTVDDADLRMVTVLGQEAWEYRDAENNFCVYIWEEEDNTFGAEVGPCHTD
jgi:hypothetical protein